MNAALIPITVHIDGGTFRFLDVAARRASALTGREVPVSELIERKLARGASQPENHVQPARDERSYQSRRTLTDANRQTIRQMTADGATANAIAAVVGCHPSTVKNYRRTLRESAATTERKTA